MGALDRLFFETIIKAICIIYLLHFVIKRLSLSSSLQTNSTTNLKESENNQTDIDDNLSESPLSDISHEEISSLRQSLKDFVNNSSQISVTNPEVSFDDQSITSPYLPMEKQYSDYRPLNMQDSSKPPVLTQKAVPLSVQNFTEKVSNGGELMTGVYAYDDSHEPYSMLYDAVPHLPVFQVHPTTVQD